MWAVLGVFYVLGMGISYWVYSDAVDNTPEIVDKNRVKTIFTILWPLIPLANVQLRKVRASRRKKINRLVIIPDEETDVLVFHRD